MLSLKKLCSALFTFLTSGAGANATPKSVRELKAEGVQAEGWRSKIRTLQP